MADEQIVLLGVTGSIAAYKAVELARLIQKQGVTVKVAMTEAATEFVTPLTFRTITGHPVATSMFAENVEWKAAHVALADEVEAILIAPATADVIAKLAHGIADDILLSTALACQKPLLVAPAMHSAMLENPATLANISMLRRRGVIFIDAESGELSSGDIGPGRLASPAAIVERLMAELRRVRDLEGRRILVTAGGTQEPVDPVRYLGNRSSGKTGYAIAEEAARRGASVTLVSAPTSLGTPAGVDTVQVMTAREMADAVFERFENVDAVVMCAAVADFAPAGPSATKIKKQAGLDSIGLTRNPDILAELGRTKNHQVLVGFAAETGDPAAEGRAKLLAKNLDLVVANDVSVPGLGFGSDENQVILVGKGCDEGLPRMSKTDISRHVVDHLVELLPSR